jgi:hypothetical protein
MLFFSHENSTISYLVLTFCSFVNMNIFHWNILRFPNGLYREIKKSQLNNFVKNYQRKKKKAYVCYINLFAKRNLIICYFK